jgi:hypothetical protein
VGLRHFATVLAMHKRSKQISTANMAREVRVSKDAKGVQSESYGTLRYLLDFWWQPSKGANWNPANPLIHGEGCQGSKFLSLLRVAAFHPSVALVRRQ